MTHDDLIYEIEQRMSKSDTRYGPFTSTHEALGVALEEWNELQAAVRDNNQMAVEHECLDLAAVMIRLARLMRNSRYMHERSMK
jgi:hypothetical protein